MSIRAGHLEEGFGVLPRAQARAFHHGGPWRVQWRPWSPRGPAVGAPEQPGGPVTE
jgi:hypothetical protein